MSRLPIVAVLGLVVISALACGPSPKPSPPEAAPALAAAPIANAPPEAASPEAGLQPAPAEPEAAPAPAGAPPETCAADADCNFAEEVQPARCAVGPAPAAGKQPAQPDGSCVCLAGRCALRPNGARRSQQTCDSALDDCGLEVATARCEPGLSSSDSPRGASYGPSCACGRADRRCHLRWFDPIPCKTTKDCWSSDEPVAHPIPRPKRLRGREFRGCVDGEHVPVCVEGRCALDALKC